MVVGRLSFREDGDLINCQRMGVGGKAVPPNVDKVHRLQLAENQDPLRLHVCDHATALSLHVR